MEVLTTENIKIFADSVGPSFMAFVGFSLLVAFLIIPLVRRDKKEGGNAGSHISIYTRLVKVETQHEILWDEYKRREK